MEIKSYNPDLLEMGILGRIAYFRGSTWAVNPKVKRSDFDQSFKRDFSNAMREYACVPSQKIEDFCKDPLLIQRKANSGRIDPFMSDGTLAEWFVPGAFTYFFHGDLALSGDSAGLCLAHWDALSNMVVIDLMVNMVPLPGQDLQFDRFRQLILTLSDRGFVFGKISFDGWQSRDTIQFLENRGYNVELFSVDRDTRAYDTLLDLLLASRLDYYYHPIFDFEFKNLVRVGKKIDHKETSSKDLCDAISAVCYHAVQENKEEFSLLAATLPAMSIGGVEIESYRQRGNVLERIVPESITPGPEDEGESRFPFLTTTLS